MFVQNGRIYLASIIDFQVVFFSIYIDGADTMHSRITNNPLTIDAHTVSIHNKSLNTCIILTCARIIFDVFPFVCGCATICHQRRSGREEVVTKWKAGIMKRITFIVSYRYV